MSALTENPTIDRQRLDKVGCLPFSGETNINIVDRALTTTPSARDMVIGFLATQGIPLSSAKQSANINLAKAYCIAPYMKAWRNRVNPSWALLDGGLTEGLTNVPPTASSEAGRAAQGATNASQAATGEMSEAWVKDFFATVETTVSKLVADKVANTRLSLDEKAKEDIRTLARTAAQIKIDENAKPRELTFRIPPAPEVKNLGMQHKHFEKLLRACLARNTNGQHLNIWLTGPTGSGKTTAAKNVAKALDLAFEAEGSLDADYKLMGFFNAQGVYVETAFFRRYTQGGMILLDEIDNYGPSALLALNAALANDFCQFPCGLRERHADTIIIAAANTWGLGATNEYVGRNKLDAASLDRFHPKMDWPVDESLELAIADGQSPDLGAYWHNLIVAARRKAKDMGLKVVISPRSTFAGLSLLASGFAPAEVIEMTFGAGIAREQHDTVVKALVLEISKLERAIDRLKDDAISAAEQAAPETGDGDGEPASEPFGAVDGWAHFDKTMEYRKFQQPVTISQALADTSRESL